MFLQDPDPIPPIMADKVQAQDIPPVGGPRATGEGAGASLSRPWKAHIVHLRLVLHLTDQQPAPVDCRFCPVHASEVCRH